MPKPENVLPYKFKKGQSGNPKGRPKGAKNRSTLVKYWLENKIKHENKLTGKEEELEVQDFMVISLIKRTLDVGDVQAFKELMDSGYGKLTESIQQENTHKLPESYDSFIDRLTGNAKPKTD